MADDSPRLSREKWHRAVTELLITTFLLGVIVVAVGYLFLDGEPLPLLIGLGLVAAAFIGAALRPPRTPVPAAHEDRQTAIRRWQKWAVIGAIVVVILLFLVLAIGVPIVP